MEDKKIHIIIDAAGGVKVDTEGFKGASCKDATKAIEAVLAQSSVETKSILKEEWYQQEDHAGGTHVTQEQNW